jgi:cardiolipin synthase
MSGESPSGDEPRTFFTIPNILTLLRIAMIPLMVVAAFVGAHLAAFCLFVGAAVTDALDGWIARRLNQRSRIGAFLDPAADKTLLVTGYIIYTLPGIATYRLPAWLTFTVFLRDLMIVMFAYMLYTRIRIRRFPPSIPGKVSTIVQVVALAVTIAANTPLAPIALPLMPIVLRICLVTTLYSGFDYVRRWDGIVADMTKAEV